MHLSKSVHVNTSIQSTLRCPWSRSQSYRLFVSYDIVPRQRSLAISWRIYSTTDGVVGPMVDILLLDKGLSAIMSAQIVPGGGGFGCVH